MGQQTYHAARRQARAQLEPRVERGLPQHPENWWIDCRDCEGSGEHLHNDSPINDPQCEYEVTCDTCGGDGVVIDGRIDALVQLRRARLNRNGYQPGVRVFVYRRLRRMALDKSYGYALLDAKAVRIQSERRMDAAEAQMIADADLCASESGRALAAWINSTRWVA